MDAKAKMKIYIANLQHINSIFTLLIDSFKIVKNDTKWITKSYIRNKIKHNNVFITRHNNIISGVIIYCQYKYLLAIDIIAVHKDHQNQHIGTNLVNHAKKIAKNKIVEVGSYSKMNNIGFWIKNDFRVVKLDISDGKEHYFILIHQRIKPNKPRNI